MAFRRRRACSPFSPGSARAEQTRGELPESGEQKWKAPSWARAASRANAADPCLSCQVG